MLAIKVRGTHQVLARAIESANQAVAELDTFVRGRGRLRKFWSLSPYTPETPGSRARRGSKKWRAAYSA
jgi:hypothetical protein